MRLPVPAARAVGGPLGRVTVLAAVAMEFADSLDISWPNYLHYLTGQQLRASARFLVGPVRHEDPIKAVESLAVERLRADEAGAGGDAPRGDVVRADSGDHRIIG
jgi:hypothetical protein